MLYDVFARSAEDKDWVHYFAESEEGLADCLVTLSAWASGHNVKVFPHVAEGQSVFGLGDLVCGQVNAVTMTDVEVLVQGRGLLIWPREDVVPISVSSVAELPRTGWTSRV